MYRTNNTYASATKNSTQRNDSENESKKATSMETSKTPYSDRWMQKDNTTTDPDRTMNSSNTRRIAKSQENTSTKKMTKKSTSSERGTTPDHAAMNVDGHVLKGQLRTSMAVAGAQIPTNLKDKAGTETEGITSYRENEDIPIEKLEMERDRPNREKSETEKKNQKQTRKRIKSQYKPRIKLKQR